MQRSPPILLLGSYICAVLDKDLRDFHISILRCEMQRSRPMLVLGCYIWAVLDKDPCDFHMSILRCEMQRSPPVLVLGCCICAVLDKDPRNFHMSILRCEMQRSPPILLLGCYICAMLDKNLRYFHMSNAWRQIRPLVLARASHFRLIIQTEVYDSYTSIAEPDMVSNAAVLVLNYRTRATPEKVVRRMKTCPLGNQK